MRKVLIPILIVFVALAGFFVFRKETRNQGTNLNTKKAEKITPKNLTYRNPVDPEALLETKKILKYFYDLSLSNKLQFIIGQNAGTAIKINYDAADPFLGHQKYFLDLEKKTGKLPSYIGVDYGSNIIDPKKISKTNELLVGYFKKGGLVEIDFSPSNPWTGKNYSESFGTGSYKYEDLFISGTEPNKRWLSDLEKLAKGLGELQEKGVAVLWRPFQEMNGNWFWWSYGENGRATSQEYLKLWKYTFNYLTKEKRIHNLLWIYGPNASSGNKNIKPAKYYYPGDDYVDIVALDYYSNNLGGLNVGGDYDDMIAIGKPFGLAEVGAQRGKGFDSLDLIQNFKTKYPNIVFMMYWNSWVNSLGLFNTNWAIIDNKHPKEFMNSEFVITLDELEL